MVPDNAYSGGVDQGDEDEDDLGDEGRYAEFLNNSRDREALSEANTWNRVTVLIVISIYSFSSTYMSCHRISSSYCPFAARGE